MIVFVIGYMGSGKSKYGRLAARHLGWRYFDLDSIIEEREGMSIAEIFDKQGEAAFRSAEQEALTGLQFSEDTVVAVGGGTPCSDFNFQFMQNSGKLIYIRLSSGMLAGRLKTNRQDRPLLASEGENLEGFIRSHLTEREQWYLKADIVIDGKNLTGKRLAEVIKASFV